MNRRFALLAVALFFAVTSLRSFGQDEGRQRSFALVVRSAVVTSAGDGRTEAPVRQYAEAHPGSYIVFESAGTLFRLDREQDVAEAERLQAPMRELATKQEALAAKQTPLAKRQQELAQEMKNAAGPEGMARIGEEQGRLGAEQGKIGQEQGRIGAQQGALGKSLNDHVQAMIDRCLRDHSCAAVNVEAPTK